MDSLWGESIFVTIINKSKEIYKCLMFIFRNVRYVLVHKNFNGLNNKLGSHFLRFKSPRESPNRAILERAMPF